MEPKHIESSILNDSFTDEDWMDLLFDISNSTNDEDDVQPQKYKDMRSILDENAINNIDLEVQVKLESNNKYNTCPRCNIECKLNNDEILCHQCGYIPDIINDSHKFTFSNDKDHNTSDNSFMSFNLVGKNAYCYQRSFLKTCANYTSFRKNNNRKYLYNYNYQYEGKKIPKNAIKLAIELFSIIKEHNYVFRGNGKKGVLGACLFYACVMNNITKTPREISSVMEIEERFLSQGDRKVQELNEKGIISIPTILRPLKDYLDQYFPALKIPNKYKSFIIDLIGRAEQKNMHIENDSRTTTKVIGAIYLLTNRIKSLNITKESIVKECDISRSTFIRYNNLLLSNYKKIKPVFKKHKIPMPKSWKSTDDKTTDKPKLDKILCETK
jgi:transcription initiation factor TFIIIB Brf1 subunit/transcription initiation factor TFIIB